VLGLTLDAAKNIAIAVAVGFVVAAVASAWIMRTVVQKVIAIVVLAALAFAVWTQRTALTDCADAVQENYARAGADVTLSDTDCSFFGFTVTISDPRTTEPGDDEPGDDGSG
jgi:hypothetical protein